MAVNIDLQNWARLQFEKSCNFVVQKGNPTVGFGGASIYQQIMEQNNTSGMWAMTEDGQMNLFNDDCLTLCGGVKKDNGPGINLLAKKGDACITSDDGNVLIKGKSITIQADDVVNIMSGKDINLLGENGGDCNSIRLNSISLNSNACTGNLAPREVTFGGLCFAGTKVGGNAIADAFTGGALPKIDELKNVAEKASKQLETLSGKIDPGALTAQATELGGQLQNQLSSIDTSGLTNALSNFGGFA